ncbi:MAG: hypothetical protein R3C56_38370 [Pirellulaceae bacterium]
MATVGPKAGECHWKICEHVSVLTDADRKVRELVRIGFHHYYRATYSLDSVEAASAWSVSRTCCSTVSRRKYSHLPVVCVLKDAESVRLAMRDSMLGVSRFVFSSDCIVHLRHDIGAIPTVQCEFSSRSSRCMIVRMPRIPLAHETELLRTARRLQPLLNVELPGSGGGQMH